MPVNYCRHLVGKTLRNVCHCDSAKMRFVGKSVIIRTFFLTLADSISFQLTRYLTHTHTHPFNGPLSGTTQVGRYQKGNTNLDICETRDSEWQWHQLGRMQVCTSLQTDNHDSTPPLSFFTVRMPFLPPNQQCQSTEGTNMIFNSTHYITAIVSSP